MTKKKEFFPYPKSMIYGNSLFKVYISSYHPDTELSSDIRIHISDGNSPKIIIDDFELGKEDAAIDGLIETLNYYIETGKARPKRRKTTMEITDWLNNNREYIKNFLNTTRVNKHAKFFNTIRRSKMNYLKKAISIIAGKEDIIGFEYNEDTIYRKVNQQQFDRLIKLLENYEDDRRAADDFIIDELEPVDAEENDAVAVLYMREPDTDWLKKNWETGEWN